MHRFAAAAVVAIGLVHAQSALKFEVASIRPHKGPYTTVGVHISGPKITIEAYGLLGLIMDAYQLTESSQVSGGPPWMSADSVRFDIAAIAPGQGPASQEEIRLMLQTLLADRFQLKVHRVTEERPVYALVVAKNGPKLKESAPGEQSSITAGGNRTAQITMANVTAERLATQLSSGLDRPVIDKTGLKGRYDVKLNWIPEFAGPPPAGSDGVNIFTAVQEQLGLKLEPHKVPGSLFVIDSAQKPSAN